MITALDVQRVARTAEPHIARNGKNTVTLTIYDVVTLTTTDDWDGNLYELHLRPAEEIAFQFNLEHGLTPAGLSLPAGSNN